MKKLLFILISTVLLASCSQNRQKDSGSDADEMDFGFCAAFCTSQIQGLCKPLVIIKTPDGWVARYGGSKASDSLWLQPRYIVNADGDSLLSFVEFYEDERNGVYVFDNIFSFDDYNQGSIYYMAENGNDTIRFDAYLMSSFAKDSNPFTLPDSVRNSSEYAFRHAGATGERMLYEIYSNPDGTIKNGLPYDEVYNAVSPDGMVRYYNTYYHLAGNGHGNLIDFSVLQYVSDDESFCIPDFSNNLFELIYEEGSFTPDFGHADTSYIFTADIDGKVYYLIETHWWDEVQTLNPESIPQNYIVSLAAFTISEGRFLPANIIDGAPVVVCVAAQASEPMHFSYNNSTKELLVPHIDPLSHNFSGRYEKLVLAN